MAANEGWRPSERLPIYKHHGWRASKQPRMAGRISGCDSESVRKLANFGWRASQRVWKAKRISGRYSKRVWKAANRRFCVSFRRLTSDNSTCPGGQKMRIDDNPRTWFSEGRRIVASPSCRVVQSNSTSDDVSFARTRRWLGQKHLRDAPVCCPRCVRVF